MFMRTYSEGHIEKNHGQWRAIISWQEEDGRRVRSSRNTGIKCFEDKVTRTGKVRVDNRGKAQALDALREWRDELIRAEEERAATPNSDTPLKKYVDDFIENKRRSGSVLPVTVDGYEIYAGHLLGTEIAKTSLGEVTSRQLQEWENNLSEVDGLHPTTIAHIHAFMGQVFRHAVRIGDLRFDPYVAVRPPRRISKPINSLNREGVARLNTLLYQRGLDDFTVAVRLALMTGMRQGEICALRWLDVDLDAGYLRVNHALSKSKGSYVLESPKTEKSRRTIPIGKELAEVLRDWKTAQRATRAEFGLPWANDIYVIGNALEKTWKGPTALGNEWRSFSKSMQITGTQGERLNFHGLR
ncbi:MAG: tyrosine-type recombinase/integrase, partial [Olegusella sp.]|nr:tyrosine-type recombinase/integrase [Olegusella sp.]